MIGVPINDPNTPGLVIVNAVLHLARIELLDAGPIRQIVERSRNTRQREVVRVLDDGNDQSPLERHRDPDVVLLAVDDLRAPHRGVQYRKGLESVGDGLDDERQEGELLARRPLEFGAMCGANPRHAREVDLEERR